MSLGGRVYGGRRGNDTEEVPVTTIDAFAASNFKKLMSPVDIIKVDGEGSDEKVKWFPHP